MFENAGTILILAPHTDDGEFGCGGAVAKFLERGSSVHYLAFSDCRDSLPADLPSDTLFNEVRAATRVLGVAQENLHVFSFPVRQFTRDRQEILELLVRFERELKPDLVFLPSLDDLHQDHHTVAKEGLRAFKHTTLLAYEIPWNNIQFKNELFVHLEERHVTRKIEALSCYRSQKDRYYANAENMMAQLRMRGCQVGVSFAEVFEVVRAIVH